MPKRRQSPYCRSGKRKTKKSALHLSSLEKKISRQRLWFYCQNEQWSEEQKVTGESSRKILGSVREVLERSDGKKTHLNQDHVLEKPTQLAVVLFTRTPFFLFMTVILVNYSDFICWPKKCETKINTIAFRLPRPPALTGYIESNCLPTAKVPPCLSVCLLPVAVHCIPDNQSGSPKNRFFPESFVFVKHTQ